VGDLAFGRTEAVAGRVLDASGAPIAGAEISVEARREEELRPSPGTAAKTGADGSFRLDAVPPGADLLVAKPGLASVRVRPHAGAIATVVLAPGVSLRGVVKKAGGRTPASGALVRFEGAAATRWVEAGADGTFTIPDVPRGRGRLVADSGADGVLELALAAPAAAPLDVVLAAPAGISGRVVDAKTTRAIPRVKLTLTSSRGELVARSKPDGTYAFGGLAGAAYALHADDPRYVAWTASDVVLTSGAAKKLDVPLTLAATLSGRVVDESGAPVAGARGSLTREAPRGITALLRTVRGADEPSAFRSGPDGTFRATRLEPGNGQRLQFRHPDHERALVGGIALAPGAVKANVTVVMKKGGLVTGRVVDTQNAPVADADVQLAGDGGGPRRGRAGPQVPPGLGGGARLSAKSGVDGRFEVKGVAPGEHTLEVSKAGYATARVESVKVKEGGATAPLAVRLEKGAAIRGSVRHKDGSPAEGYVVLLGGLRGRRTEPTGPDGSFAIERLKDGESYDLQVASGTGLGAQKNGITAPADGVEILVPGPGRIAGRALEAASGRPLTDFTVTYEPDTGGPGGARFFRAASRVAGGALAGTGEPKEFHAGDGAFLLEDVPAGTWRITVASAGFQSAHVGSISVEEGATKSGVEARLQRGTHLSGRATDAQDGHAIPGVAITYQLVGGAPAFRIPGVDDGSAITTDADGHYEIADVAPGRYQVTARHPDYTSANATADVAVEGAAGVDLQLSSGGEIGGVVLTDTRQPAAGIEVDLGGAGGGGFGRMLGGGNSTLTDPSGRFVFQHLAAARYTVSASAQGKTATPVDVVLNAGESHDDLVLLLSSGTTIHGTVSGLPSSMIAGVNVTASGPDSFTGSSRTGSDGTYEIAGAPAGAINLRATAGDVTRSRTATKQVTLTGEEPLVVLDIVFEDGFRISGSVTRRGAPVPGAMVVASQQGAGGRTASARSDEGGAYVLDGLAEGTYNVTASMPVPGGASRRQTVTVSDDQSLDLALPSASITGSVVEASSRVPLEGATVQVDPGDGSPLFRSQATTDSNGRFTLDGLDEKSYTATFRRPQFQSQTRSVNASESGGEDLTVELARGEGIGIQVLDGIYGVPLHGVVARVFDAQKATVFSGGVTLDDQGRGEIPSLPPGRYAVWLDAGGYALTTLPAVDVPQPTLRVAMTPGGTLEIDAGPQTLGKGSVPVQILGADGAPAPLSLFAPTGALTLVAPVRTIQNVAPGTYYIVVNGGSPMGFQIAEGRLTPVTLP
jgi:protocatechuate 3,4-dioxygenase beta subunit